MCQRHCPARDEEVVIAACVESLVPQTEIAEIFGDDDQSSMERRRLFALFPRNIRK